MEEERIDDLERDERKDVFSKAVRAGKRTYFFDVKATKKDEFYLTITESKKRITSDGKPVYEKHKIFLYKEDFEKFVDGLHNIIEYIKLEQPFDHIDTPKNNIDNLDFDDL
jgi:hypothetical protein